MKKIYIIILIIACASGITACRSNAIKGSEYISIENAFVLEESSFRFYRLEGNVIVENMDGHSVRVSLVDSLLFFIDANAEKLLHIYSIPNQRFLGSFGNRGRGPNELLSIGHIHEGFKKGIAGGYDVTQRKWLEFKIPETLATGNFAVERVVNIPKEQDIYHINDPIPIDENHSVFTCLQSYESRCYVSSLNLDSYIEFINPDITFHKKLSDFILSDLFSSNISLKPDKSRVALGGRYIDLIEIFDIDNTHVFTGVGPVSDLEISIDIARSSERQAFIKTPKTRRAFLNVKSTNEYIYLLYSGKQRQDVSDYFTGNHLYVIDWNGKPVAHFEMDVSLCDFAINEENSVLYGIQLYPIPSLIKCDLTGL